MNRQWPLPQNSFRITSRFAGRVNPVTGRPENHSGTDFAAPDGTPFYAVAGGRVKFIGPASGYGQWIVIDHPASEGGGCSEYGHMWNAYATGLKVGDWVERGQLIGYIGSNGQSTGPHLHLTIWEYAYGGRRVDPETWLAKATYPPVGGGTGIVVAPAEPNKKQTIYGVDVSNHQNGLSLKKVESEGFRFVFIKATEGTWKDPVFKSHLADAKGTKMHYAAYVYVRQETSAKAHADALEAQCPDKSVPIALDIENNSGSSVAHWKSIVTEIERRGYRVILTYLPRWYWQRVGSPVLAGLPPLWSSNYPSVRSDYASVLYASAGTAGWGAYGGLNVKVWQFTDRARVAGWKIDANAFVGTENELKALFKGTGKPDIPGKEVGPIVNEPKMKTDDFMRAVFEQFAGYKYREDGKSTWVGWDVRSTIANAKRKLRETGACTPVEVLFLANEDRLMGLIEEEKK